MASFDITSLYTNVPLDETINIILENLLKTMINSRILLGPNLKNS